MTQLADPETAEALRFLSETGGIPAPVSESAKPEDLDRADALDFLAGTGGIPQVAPKPKAGAAEAAKPPAAAPPPQPSQAAPVSSPAAPTATAAPNAQADADRWHTWMQSEINSPRPKESPEWKAVEAISKDDAFFKGINEGNWTDYFERYWKARSQMVGHEPTPDELLAMHDVVRKIATGQPTQAEVTQADDLTWLAEQRRRRAQEPGLDIASTYIARIGEAAASLVGIVAPETAAGMTQHIEEALLPGSTVTGEVVGGGAAIVAQAALGKLAASPAQAQALVTRLFTAQAFGGTREKHAEQAAAGEVHSWAQDMADTALQTVIMAATMRMGLRWAEKATEGFATLRGGLADAITKGGVTGGGKWLSQWLALKGIQGAEGATFGAMLSLLSTGAAWATGTLPSGTDAASIAKQTGMSALTLALISMSHGRVPETPPSAGTPTEQERLAGETRVGGARVPGVGQEAVRAAAARAPESKVAAESGADTGAKPPSEVRPTATAATTTPAEAKPAPAAELPPKVPPEAPAPTPAPVAGTPKVVAPAIKVGMKGTYDFGGGNILPVEILEESQGRTRPNARYPQGKPQTVWKAIDLSTGRFFNIESENPLGRPELGQMVKFKPAEPAPQGQVAAPAAEVPPKAAEKPPAAPPAEAAPTPAAPEAPGPPRMGAEAPGGTKAPIPQAIVDEAIAAMAETKSAKAAKAAAAAVAKKNGIDPVDLTMAMEIRADMAAKEAGAEPTGPGKVVKAVPAEAPPAEVPPEALSAGEGTPPEVMSPKLASTAEGRERVGLPKRTPPVPKTDAELVAAAKAELADRPDAGRVLVEDPARIKTDQDEVVLGLHLTRLRNEWNAAADRLSETKKTGDMAAHAEAKADLDRLTPELDRAFGVAEGLAASTNPARMLRARQLGFTRDYSLAQAKQNWTAAHDGETPPPKVMEKLKDKVETLNKVEGELAAKAEKGEADAEKWAARKAYRSLTKPVPKRTPPAKAGEAARTEALDRFAGRNLEPGREQSAALGALANKIAKMFVAEGVRDREQLFSAVHGELKKVDPEITRRDSDMALSGYGRFRPLSPAEGAKFLRQAKQETQLLLKIEDVLNKNPLLRSGPDREPLSDEGRRLTQLLNEYKRKYGVVVTDPAKQLKSVLDGIKTRLRNRISDLQDQIAKGEKTVKTKTTVVYDAEATALKMESDALKREFDEIFGKPELTDAQRVERAIAATERSEAAIAARIESGTYADLFPGKKISKTPNTEALRAARAQHDARRAELEELRALAAPGRTPEDRAIKASMTRLTNRIAELQGILASGEYGTEPPPLPRLKTRAELALEAKKQKLQWELDAKRESGAEKVLRTALDVTGVQRTMLTGGDISNTFRQMLFVLWNDLGQLATGKPGSALKWARSTSAEVKAFVSGPRAARTMEILANDPDYQLLRRYGMEHVEYARGTSEGKRPEGFPSQMASKWPGIAQSMRAAAVTTNMGRREIGVEMMNAVRASGRELTPDVLRRIARVANDSTGRTTLPKGSRVREFASIANHLMFSPRLLGSRIENIRTLFHAIDADPAVRAYGIRTLIGGFFF